MQIPEAVRTVERDLRAVFGDRLRSLVVYRSAAGDADDVPTLAIVDGLSADDLRACANHVAAWHDAGLATPLLLAEREFGRALDAFPFEFGAIIADHAVVAGTSPFAGLSVDPAHLRHACEVQARSHLLHLREGYLETRGRSDAVAELIVRSAGPLAALLHSVARLHDARPADAAQAAAVVESGVGLPSASLSGIVALSSNGQIAGDDAKRRFPVYLDAVQRLVDYIDQWSAR